jgi:hypothetical protein
MIKANQARHLPLILATIAGAGVSVLWFIYGRTDSFPRLPPSYMTAASSACGDLLPPQFIEAWGSNWMNKAPSSRELAIGPIKLRASEHFLTATTSAGKAVAGVPQLDYGTVEALHISQSGEVFVIGGQLSYRLKASEVAGKPVLTEPKTLPGLFAEKCGLLDRIEGGCDLMPPVYSSELKAVFLYGGSAFGFKSLILGLISGDRDISKSDTPFFLGDIPKTGRVLLGGPKNFALFDGTNVIPCEAKKMRNATIP